MKEGSLIEARIFVLENPSVKKCEAFASTVVHDCASTAIANFDVKLSEIYASFVDSGTHSFKP